MAPASPPLQPKIIDTTAERFESLGFKVRIGKNARLRRGFIAGSDKARLADLDAAFRSKTTKAIICIRGGYGSTRLLPSIDFTAFRKNPKILVGLSDITALLCALSSGSGVTTFHGPMPQSLADPLCPQYSWKRLIDALTADSSSIGSIVKGCPKKGAKVEMIQKGRATGFLMGGNLSMLCSLLGTPYFPDLSKKIVILEEIGEAPYRIDRLLTQLIHSGALNSAAGVALGTFTDCEYKGKHSEYRQTLRDVLRERLTPLGKPVAVGLPFGHTPYNATLPLGTLATLDATAGDLLILEHGVA